MAELRRVFSGAKMNKDLDERLVPTGQYRDALNIEISTSEGSEVGTVQNLLGNTKHNTMVASTGFYDVQLKSTCVGSIAAQDKDKVYYLVSGGDQYDSDSYVDVRKDYIMEYDTVLEKHKYVFVDIYSVKTTVDGAITAASSVAVDLGYDNSTNVTGIRTGMLVTGTFTNSSGASITSPAGQTVANNTTYQVQETDNVMVTAQSFPGNKRTYALSKPLTIKDGDVIYFKAPRVLNFSKNTIITGINILDDFLFWTDNVYEPKKINILRSIVGTGGLVDLVTGDESSTFEGDTPYFHTRLVKDKDAYTSQSQRYETVYNSGGTLAPVYVNEGHITVIKKAPTQPLELEMFRSSISRVNPLTDVENPTFGTQANQSYVTDDGTLIESGESISISFDGNPVDFREGDILLFSPQGANPNPEDFDDYYIRAEVTSSNVTNASNLFLEGFVVRIISINLDAQAITSWFVKREGIDPLFMFKFPRFSYRYKYQDGEYSTFAPWSEVAFLPDAYEYKPKKGHNLGMVNQLRGLKLKYYHHRGHQYNSYEASVIPQDVVEIDLLYKETTSPTVYTVKTINKENADPIWPDYNSPGDNRGEFEITTDMIHAVVASNQLIRPWDNVPRKALAQEISANRLIYGNYLQNYTVLKDPIISVSVSTDPLYGANGYAMPSVKSMRTYQVGVVFSDEHGRETPVLTSKESTASVPKSASSTRNRLACSLKTSYQSPSWAKYLSYYVKEITSEYYSMAMDRWYTAADGNIWISFPSSDRNKVDEEDYIVLKKAHGSDTAVTEKTRYKILAIENEAPDFIKTRNSSLGILLDTDANLIGNSVEGYPIEDATFIDIETSSFVGTWGSLLENRPDNLGLVITGGGIRVEYDVSSIVVHGGDHRVYIVDKFGVEIEFASDNGLYSGRIDSLGIEFLKRVKINKPEFDGRFFAKIFKDSFLERYIIQNAEDELTISMSGGVRYMNNNGWSNLPIGGVIPTNLQTNNSFSYSYSSHWHPTENAFHTSELQPYGQGQPVRVWGGDDGEAFGLGLGGNAMLSLNYSEYNGTGDARAFWTAILQDGDFFIDCCTAYSWTGRGTSTVTFDGDTNNTIADAPGSAVQVMNTVYEDLGGPAGSIAWISAGDVGDDSDTNSPYANHPNSQVGYGYYPGPSWWPSAFKYQKGQPSRGIWGPNNTYMDLSFSGIRGGYTYGSSGNPNYPPDVRLDQAANVNPTASVAYDFIQMLSTVGTKFRFRNDPDDTVYTVSSEMHDPGGYWDADTYHPRTSKTTGVWGIRNYVYKVQESDHSTSYQTDADILMNEEANIRQRWTIVVSPGIGSGPSGYNPIRGTKSPQWGGPAHGEDNYRRALNHDYTDKDVIDILVSDVNSFGSGTFTENPGVWETEPKETVDLDIYYQASGLIPIKLDSSTNEEYIPIGSTFNLEGSTSTYKVIKVTDQTIHFTPLVSGSILTQDNAIIKFTKRGNYSFTAVATGDVNSGSIANGSNLKLYGGTGTALASNKIPAQTQYLDWNNCWCFGNGVESDRVRDDFNGAQMDNGVKASSVLAEQVREERRKHGLIWSGIYNSAAGVNETNQFIAGESITKDLNPIYGSIQAILNRDTRLVLFCEDKVLRAVTNKDALYNADGKPQLVASNTVVGDVTPYQGNYGVSTHPESIAVTPSNVYFSDSSQGQVLRLTTEGIVSISDLGMKDYFGDLSKSYIWRSLGTYDQNKKEYNLTVSKKYGPQIIPHSQDTASYSEISKGWSSFKSFFPESGLSINNNYYTFDGGQVWKHHDNLTRNNFYGVQYASDITVLFNDRPEAVKSFATINYEGSAAKVTAFELEAVQFFNNNITSTANSASNGLNAAVNTGDGEYYNLDDITGWYTEDITTNIQRCGSIEFKEKENKYFGKITGTVTGVDSESSSNPGQPSIVEVSVTRNAADASVQGLGIADIAHSDSDQGSNVYVKVLNNTSTTYKKDAGSSGDAYDATSDSSNWRVSYGVNQTFYWFGEAGVAIPSDQTVGYPNNASSLGFALSPILANGSYSGFPLSAENFIIGGSPSGSHGAGWTGGNMDSQISKVTFTDVGIAGQPDNLVTVTVLLSTGYTPTANSIAYIDIDLVAEKVMPRDHCLDVAYDFHAATIQTHPIVGGAVTNIPGITETAINVGSSLPPPFEQPTLNRHSGALAETGVPIKVAEYTFTRAGAYYYAGQSSFPSVEFEELGVYEPYYSYEIDPTYTSNLLTSFGVSIYYTPPSEPSLLQDPEDFCALGHKATILYTPLIADVEGLGINVVDYEVSVAIGGGEQTIVVQGIANTKYKLSVQKKTSTTSTITASTLGYYNFATNEFQTAATTEVGVIGANGRKVHYVSFPEASETTRYDVTVDNIVDGVIATISDSVPTFPGEASIIAYGTNTLTVTPYSNTSGNFGTIPTVEIIRPIVPPGITPQRPKTKFLKIYTNGNTGSAGDINKGLSTRLALDKADSRIKPGMFVSMNFKGNRIPDKTKVVSVKRNIITLSTACSILSSDSLVIFNSDSSVIPFSLSIPAGSGKTIYLKDSTTVDFASVITGLTSVSTGTTAAVGTSLRVTSVRGIVAGMLITGVGATADAQVVSVSQGGQAIISSPAQPDIPSGAILTFSHPNTASGSSGNNSGVKVEHLQASMDDGKLKVEGYLKVSDINTTAELTINIDDLVTVN